MRSRSAMLAVAILLAPACWSIHGCPCEVAAQEGPRPHLYLPPPLETPVMPRSTTIPIPEGLANMFARCPDGTMPLAYMGPNGGVQELLCPKAPGTAESPGSSAVSSPQPAASPAASGGTP